MIFPLIGTVSIILLSVLIPVFVIIIVVFVIIYIKRRFLRQASSLKSEYDYYHNLLVTDCRAMLVRLKTLGESDEGYKRLFDEKSKDYDDISELRDKKLLSSLETIDKLIDEKNYKEAREKVTALKPVCDSYVKAVMDLNENLNSILRDDNDAKELTLSVKEKYRNIKSFYDVHKAELKPLDESFNIIFKNTEDTLVKFDQLSNQAQYKEAKELLPPLTSVLDAVLSILPDLPNLVARAYVVLDENLQKLNNSYQQMISEGYVLDHLHVDEVTSSLSERIKRVQEKLRVMDVNGVRDELDDIQNQITDLLSRFQSEKLAKTEFEQMKDTISNSSYTLEKNYTRLLNELPSYQATYLLDQKYVNEIRSMKDEIEAIGFLKREIDSYLNETIRQPYTSITEKIHEMQSKINRVQKCMDDYNEYINSLKDLSQKEYSAIRETYYKLKQSECISRQINVPNYEKKLRPDFQDLYQRLVQINSILITTPIDVHKAYDLFDSVSKEAEQLENRIDSDRREAEAAEQAITRANSCRDFEDSTPLLARAQQQFLSFDFKQARLTADEVSKTFSYSNHA